MEEGDYRSIYDLKLHEEWQGVMQWGIRYNVTRVPGGWIYQAINRPVNGSDAYLSATFVPFTKELKNR